MTAFFGRHPKRRPLPQESHEMSALLRFVVLTSACVTLVACLLMLVPGYAVWDRNAVKGSFRADELEAWLCDGGPGVRSLDDMVLAENSFTTDGPQRVVCISRGVVMIHTVDFATVPPFPQPAGRIVRQKANVSSSFIRVPNLALLAALSSLTLLLGWNLFAARRVAFREDRGLCVACGYDLRGGTQRVCPECGAETVMRTIEQSAKTGASKSTTS